MKHAVRWTALVLAVAFTLIAGPRARAQHDGAGSAAAPDVPSGPAAIRGRVLRPASPASLEGLEVALYALRADGIPGLRKTTTAADGGFAFEGISNDADTAYLVGARFGDVPFPGERVTFQPGEIEKRVEIKLADTSRDPRAVSVTESRLRIDRVATGLRVSETHHLRNAGATVVFAPKAERESGSKPSFRASLPEGARNLAHPLGLKPDGLVQDGNELAFYGPVYPGEQELSFSYDLPLAPGASTVNKRFPSGAARVVIRSPKEGPAIRADGLGAVADVTEDGRSYASVEKAGVSPGATLAFDVQIAAMRDDPNALQVEEARIFVELDDAVLLAREEYALRVDGDTPLLGSAESPLLVIPLPAGAEDLRFATASAGLGLASDPRGLAVLGPIGPGNAQVDIVYRVPIATGPIATGPIDFDRSFAKPVPLLSFFIADTGLVPESERLHRRRPVRGEDHTYTHLEAFDVEAEENVPLRITPLARGGGLANGLAIALVLAAAAGAAAYLSGPLLRAGASGRDEDERPALRSERESIYAELRDLEDDFEAGKLLESDFQAMRSELRARAAALIQAEREAAAQAPSVTASAAQPVATTPRCDACGRAARAEDRFCAQCGAQIAVQRPGEAQPGAPA